MLSDVAIVNLEAKTADDWLADEVYLLPDMDGPPLARSAQLIQHADRMHAHGPSLPRAQDRYVQTAA
jgi:hypothetical protein